ncbi:MAG: hypothetical protein QE285_01720 [Aquabacterium sp.]|nr:hypothetical protein [Aquabacterium sp.]
MTWWRGGLSMQQQGPARQSRSQAVVCFGGRSPLAVVPALR